MSEAIGRHFLDGVDIYLGYGVIVSGGAADFEVMPRRKPSLSFDWEDENGTQVDLSNPKFEDQEATLNIVFLADSFEEYRANRQNFETALLSAGWHEWTVADNNVTRLVYYVNETNPRKVTRFQNIAKIAFQSNLILKLSTNDADVPGGGGSGDPVTIFNPDGSVNQEIPSGGSYTIPSITIIEGGDLALGDEQYSPALGVIIGEPL